ncbi:MAG: flagellar basal body rod protein FlgB [Aeromonas sobria]
MGISFEAALGVHPDALNFRVERSRVLASNLANADTPNYAARDIEFAQQEMNLSSSSLMRPIKPLSSMDTTLQVKYRMPHQVSRDGNTVETGIEQARIAENYMDFQTSLQFLNSKINGLAKAIEGK